MTIQTRTTDRSALIDFLKNETGEKAVYLGPPTFQYVIGPYTVLRNADIDCRGAEGDDLVPHLQTRGFLEEPEEDGICASFETDDVRGRMNLLNMISARGDLINKAVGHENTLLIHKDFLEKMQKANPANLEEFREAMVLSGAKRGLIGLQFLDNKVIFTRFPEGNKEEKHVYLQLANCMVKTSETQKWVKPETEMPENEKYSFRFWLITIGMKGTQYQEARRLLLSRLNGNSSYRTIQQKDEAMRRQQEEHKGKEHEDFIIL